MKHALKTSLIPLLLGVLAACDSSSAAPPLEIELVDVTEAAGIDVVNVCGDPRRWYIPESQGCGAAWLDHDGDGDVDLFVANGAGLEYIDDGRRLELQRSASSRLYANEGGLRFSDVTEATGAGFSGWINASSVADVENDGDPDLYLACFGPDALLLNGEGTFHDALREVGLGGRAAELWGAGASFADADNDGDLDLYVANYCMFDLARPPAEGKRQVYEGVEIGWGPEEENKQGYNVGAPDRFYLNDGKGRFQDATAAAGLEIEKPLCSYAVVFSDVDRDGWQDILVANDLQPCNLFHNEGGAKFTEQGFQRGFALNAEGNPTAAMGLFVEDVDQDGDFDVLRTNFDMEENSLHLNDGKGNFTDRARDFGLAEASFDKLGWGGGFFDADSDGDFDLLIANGHVLPQAESIGMHGFLQRSQLFRGVPDEGRGIHFEEVLPVAGGGLDALRSARGVAFADPDQDGDLDAIVVDLDHRPRLLENRTQRRGHWLGVRLRGTTSNRDGIGAVVTVFAKDRQWTREVRRINGLYSSHSPELHFGLGAASNIERIEVLWPTGKRQVVEDPQLDQLVRIEEEEAG